MSHYVDTHGNPVETLQDWRALVGAGKWADGRSAKRLAESWLESENFPPPVAHALYLEPAFTGLIISRGIAEHLGATPGRGGASATDLMVHASRIGSTAAIAVEGKVDEGFDEVIGIWLQRGRSVRSGPNRRRRLDAMCNYLGVDPAATDSIRYQLVHRTHSACVEAERHGCDHAMLMIHSFSPDPELKPGWDDVVLWAELLCPQRDDMPEPDRPWLCKTVADRPLWFTWVSDLANPADMGA